MKGHYMLVLEARRTLMEHHIHKLGIRCNHSPGPYPFPFPYVAQMFWHKHKLMRGLHIRSRELRNLSLEHHKSHKGQHSSGWGPHNCQQGLHKSLLGPHNQQMEPGNHMREHHSQKKEPHIHHKRSHTPCPSPFQVWYGRFYDCISYCSRSLQRELHKLVPRVRRSHRWAHMKEHCNQLGHHSHHKHTPLYPSLGYYGTFFCYTCSSRNPLPSLPSNTPTRDAQEAPDQKMAMGQVLARGRRPLTRSCNRAPIKAVKIAP